MNIIANINNLFSQIFLTVKSTLLFMKLNDSLLFYTKVSTIISIPAWIFIMITEWTLSNKDYITGVLVCIAIDHIIGSAYHLFKKRDFKMGKNAKGLLIKLSFCVGSIILFEIIHDTVRNVPFIYEYLKVITRLIVILYPAGSAFVNMSEITNGIFPPIGWIKKIHTFNEYLDLEKLKK